MDRFFGGSALAVVLRLALISFAVGVVMATLGISPQNLIHKLRQFIQTIYDLGFGSIEWILQYLMLGALVVIPIWLIVRIFSVGRGSRDNRD